MKYKNDLLYQSMISKSSRHGTWFKKNWKCCLKEWIIWLRKSSHPPPHTPLTFTLDQGPQSMLRSCAGWNCISTIASLIFLLMETVAPPVCLLCHLDYSHMYILWSWIGFVSQGAGLPKTINKASVFRPQISFKVINCEESNPSWGPTSPSSLHSLVVGELVPWKPFVFRSQPVLSSPASCITHKWPEDLGGPWRGPGPLMD